LVVTPLGGEHEYGVWKEVTVIAIEMSVGVSGCKEGKTRWKAIVVPWWPKVL
jgi:hypothetical protein